MATVTNWIDHLSAKEVAGAVYPGAGSSETLLVILGIVLWIGWHVLTAKTEGEKLNVDIAPNVNVVVYRSTVADVINKK